MMIKEDILWLGIIIGKDNKSSAWVGSSRRKKTLNLEIMYFWESSYKCDINSLGVVTSVGHRCMRQWSVFRKKV